MGRFWSFISGKTANDARKAVMKTTKSVGGQTSAVRIFLVRHGEPEQHSGKIFLGQFDVSLSERGKQEASFAGESLARRNARPRRIYTSDLSRARETADIISEELGGIPVVPDKLFREMAMGIWDGELIEDIKAKFPEEYAKRGDDLRNYRVPGGENFYDLRGRVLREFHRIFAEDIRGVRPASTEAAEQAPGAIDIASLCATYDTDDSGVVSEAGAVEGITSSPAVNNVDSISGDLVIVAHLGVIAALAEELQPEIYCAGKSHYFGTGSVTMIEAPEWLLPGQSPQ